MKLVVSGLGTVKNMLVFTCIVISSIHQIALSQNGRQVRSEITDLSVSNFKPESVSGSVVEYISPVYNISVEKIGKDLWYKATFSSSIESISLIFDIRFMVSAGTWTDWTELNMEVQANALAIYEYSSQLSFTTIDAVAFQVRCFASDQIDPNKFITNESKVILYNFEDWIVAIPSDSTISNLKSGGCFCPQPSYVTRSGWGCWDGDSPSCDPPVYTEVTHLIVHHEAGSNDEPVGGWDDRVFSIWYDHVFLSPEDFCDIAYNWLIDHDGIVYEGRGGGDNVQGAHMCGASYNTMGVCILGNMSLIPVPIAAKSTLVDLLSWKACQEGIDPLGMSYHDDPSPGTLLENIAGHSDGCADGYTECPGTYLYSDLSEIRESVNECVSGGTGAGYDISIIDVDLSDYSIYCDESFTITVTAENIGYEFMEAPNLSYYLSSDCIIGDGDEYGLGTDIFADLDVGEADNETITVSMPTGYPSGSYYILALADYTDSYAEINELNNVLCAEFSYTCDELPDLILTDYYLSETTVECNQEIDCFCTGWNVGGAPIDDADIAYYFSVDNVLSADDIELGTDDLPSLEPGESSDESDPLVLPSGYESGTYYILFVIDYEGVVDELDELNNVEFVEIEYSCSYDIAAYFISVDEEAISGETVSGTVRFVNEGDVVIPDFSYSLSRTGGSCVYEEELDDITTAGGTVFLDLAPGEYYDASFTISIISDLDVEYIKVYADDETVYSEFDELNNFDCFGISIIDPFPVDVGVTALINPTSGCDISGFYSLEFEVFNYGASPVSGVYIGYQVDGGGLFALTYPGEILPGASVIISTGESFDFTGVGEHNVLVWTDMDEDIYSENDTLYAIILNIDEPVIDLGPSISACDSVILDAGNPGFDYLWSTGETSQQIVATETGYYSVTVESPGGECSSSDDVFVSISYSPSASFTYIADGLSVSFSSTSEFGDTFSWDFGDGFTSIEENPSHSYVSDGTYAVVLEVSNDCGISVFSGTISVTIAGDGLPDLTGYGLTVSPSVVIPGELVTVSFTMQNIGDADVVGDFISRYKVSLDCELGSDDIKIHTAEYSDLPSAGESIFYSIVDTIPDTLSAGVYYIHLKIDAQTDIDESDEDNNFICSGAVVVEDSTSEELPDLLASIVSVAGSIYPGSFVELGVDIYNVGLVISPFTNYSILITDDCIGEEFQLLSTNIVSAILPGSIENYIANISIPLEWESGSSYIYVVVDEDDIVSEISESNNTDCELVNISSLLNAELGSSLNIYPNPASDLLNVSATGQILLQDVTIVNNLSQAVALLNPTDEFSLQSVSIDISRIPSGIYWAVIVTNQGVYKEPIIVE